MTSLSPDMTVGISISSPSDIGAYGMGQIHVRHAFVEIARHVLSAGAGIAYGGDFRAGGYTQAMFDLVRTYNGSDRPGPERVLNYMAWPILDDLPAADRAAVAQVATLVRVDAPDGAPPVLPPKDQRDAQARTWAALSFTVMRTQLAADVQAQVILGGKTSGQTGVLPGIAEEAALALETHGRLYLLGGFGGCAHVVAAALRGERPPELTLDYQLEVGNDHYRNMIEAIGYDIARDRFRGVGRTLAAAGWPDLSNGLSSADNERLVESDDVEDIVILVLRGLRSS